jgi:hypothetical protein
MSWTPPELERSARRLRGGSSTSGATVRERAVGRRPAGGLGAVFLSTFSVSGGSDSVGVSGDLDPLTGVLHSDAEGAPEGCDVSAESVDQRPLGLTPLETGHPVSTHVETCGQLDPSEMGGLATFTELVSADLVEHAALVGV